MAQDLQPVFAELPKDNDQFEFALTNGENSRLWVDMTSFVRMGRDRRVYEFVKDTRMGRTMLGETDDRARMAKLVTNYVAERVLERERMIEGEWVAMRDYNFGLDEEDEAVETPQQSRGRSLLGLVGWFLLGLAGGASAMIAWAWFGDIPTFLQ